MIWDPAEWGWRKIERFKEAPLFGYIGRRRYLQGLKLKGERPILIQKFNNQGFTKMEIRQSLQFLWHNAKLKKQAMLIWQVLNHGIVTGEWLSW